MTTQEIDTLPRLSECETIIERGLSTFVEVGNALLEIRDSRLYRESHGTFEDYCRVRWGMNRRRANQLVEAAVVVGDLGKILPKLPATESHARELAAIEPPLRASVWERALETAPEGKVTAAHVRETARRVVSEEVRQGMRERIAPKMDRLKALEEQGVYIGSVWSFGSRETYAGDGKYHGNSIPQIVENAVLLYTEPGAHVVDPMAGSGTTVDVCAALGRECSGFDIQPQNARAGIETADAADLSRYLPDACADMVFWHPPYWNMVVYSREDGDISALDWSSFLDASRRVLREIRRILKPDAALVMLTGDKVQAGRFYPVTRSLANMADECGLVDCGAAIKTTVNSTSQIVKGRTIWAELAHSGNLKVEHDTISVFRAPA